MNVGSTRRAAPWVVVFLTAGAAGCTCTYPTTTKLSQCPVQNKEHVVLLRAETKDNGKAWKAIAHPDFITIRGYNPVKPDSVVYWAYREMSIDIGFEDSAMGNPVCTNGECKLELPRDLKLKPYKYKYTVTGKHDNGIVLVPNDPWIEVDR